MQDQDKTKQQLIDELSEMLLKVAELQASHTTLDTERKQVEDELREHAEELEDLYNNAPCGYHSLGRDGTFVRINDTELNWLGYSREEVIGKIKFADILTNESLKTFQENFPGFKKRGWVKDLEFDLIIKDGTVFSVIVSVTAIRDNFGNYVMSRSTVFDITARKRAEEELLRYRDHLESLVKERTTELEMTNLALVEEIGERELSEKALSEKEQMLKTILATSPVGIGLFRDRRFVWMNDRGLKMFGYENENEFIGQSTRIVFATEDEFERIGRALYTDLQTERIARAETKFLRKDGSVFHARVRMQLVDPSSPENFTIAAITDITDQIRAEQEKESLRTQLIQSQKMEALGTLVGGIAHDFNNMLQSILGYSEMLLIGKKKGEPGYKELQTIIETGQGGADLVKKLLAFGQEAPIFPIPLDLNHQVRQLTTLISRTLPPVVQIDVDLSDGPATICADHNQIDQVVMHLAINASEAMPNGGLLKIATTTVSLDEEYCSVHHGAKPGNYVMLSVSDTGRGMDKETLARIFDPFFSTKQRGATRGTGLGLSVVQGIVQQQGGRVTCESEPGKGTEFKIYFPAIEAPLMTAKTIVPTVKSEGTETILVVEDNIPVVELEQRILENAGYKVIVATRGQEALDIYQTRKEEISLVILDLLMPEMSGRDCLMELLKIDPSVKVLIASGYAPEDELLNEISPLVKGFVHKPFAIAELLTSVRSVMVTD